MADTKRSRGKNFLESEKDMLIDLIVPHKSIIENIKVSKNPPNRKNILLGLVVILNIVSYIHFMKLCRFQTDNATNKSKDIIWEQITIDYNVHQKSGIRSINQLKNVYDNLKRVTRKEKSDQKVGYILSTVINFSH